MTEDSINTTTAADQFSTYADADYPVQIHLRNFSVTTTGSVSLGSADVFGSLGSMGS